MIIYLHGFASSKNSHKARQMDSFKPAKVLALDLDEEPSKALILIESTIRSSLLNEPVVLMGSSLGGYYALCMARKFNLSAILINPSIKPYKTLARFVGVEQKNFSKSGSVIYKQEYIDQLKSQSFDGVDQTKILLMLQTGDKDLDYRIALSHLPQAQHYVQEGGSHAFDDFEKNFDRIETFYNQMVTV